MNLRDQIEQRIERIPIAGCWLWMSRVGTHGYGRFRVNGRDVRAHRFVYEVFRGEIHDGLFVLHHCDVPCCVNPAHLYVGTQFDNMRDMARRGRGNAWSDLRRRTKPIGERNGAAKLSENDVRAIKAAVKDGALILKVATEYSIHWTHVSRIVRGQRWRHVT